MAGVWGRWARSGSRVPRTESGVSVEFRLLGPLAVVDDDGAELVVPRRMERLLLAMLLLHRNTRVATDTIIGTLWRDRAPASAYANIQSHVSVLRGLLGDRARLTTRPGGYLLRTSEDEVDAARFERLAATGRRELAAGRPEAALRHLT